MPTATKDAEIKFRTSDELKRQTRRVYDRWGLTLSEAFNLFMRKSVEVGGLPFDLRPEPPSYDALAATAYKAPINSDGVAVLPADWDDGDE